LGKPGARNHCCNPVPTGISIY